MKVADNHFQYAPFQKSKIDFTRVMKSVQDEEMNLDTYQWVWTGIQNEDFRRNGHFVSGSSSLTTFRQSVFVLESPLISLTWKPESFHSCWDWIVNKMFGQAPDCHIQKAHIYFTINEPIRWISEN